MGGTTPILSIPYVTATDLLANYPVADKAQADRVESLIASPYRQSRNSAWLTAAAGWTITVNQLDTFSNNLRFLQVNATRSGAAITVPANGDIASSLIGTYATAGIASYGPISSNGGRLCQFSMFSSGLYLTAVASGADFASGEIISAVGIFFGGS